MRYNPDIHHRKSIRLKGYDYSSQGLYFITLCVNKNICLFGEILDGEHKIFESGKMIEKYWLELENKYSNILLHDHVVMPNHFHGIIEITGNSKKCDCKICINDSCTGAPCGYPVNKNEPSINKNEPSMNHIEHQGTHKGSPYKREKCLYNKGNLGNIIGAFKSQTTNAYIKNVKENNWESFYQKLWHRNYHEYIIRNEDGYSQISDYITSNPQKWNEDKFYVTQI